MSGIIIQGNTSGTGIFTITSSNSDTSRTLTLPDETGTVLTSGGAIDVNASAPADSVVIDSSGNVGIGTSSPDALLDIEGPSATHYINATSGNANTYYELAGTLTGSIEVGGGDSVYLSARNAAGDMIFRTGGTNERMRIHSSGVVSVNSASVVGAERFGVKYDGSTVNGIGIETTSSAAGAGFMVFRNEGGSAIGTISRNGGTNAVNYNTTSDYRLKENITPLTNALDRVSALNPVQWTWKDCDGAAGEGFIAHEVQAVAPLAVTGEKDAVDSEGNIKPQGMDSSYLVALLTKAIQEQQQTIELLEARVASLESA